MAGKSKKQRSTAIFTVYLYRNCKRARQEGTVVMNEPSGGGRGFHFDYLDSIPRKIRDHLEAIGLTYDVADDSDETVITEKRRKRKVVGKIRKGDPV
ncbi:MAG TPA: hypothetical protein VGK22_10690 [Candidatus Angelobacter sp.]